MKLLYPRYCVLDVQQQEIVACLRLQEIDGQAHKEVRTFGREVANVVVLSNWLASHAVTHVAIKPSAGAWKPLYQALQQAFTVLQIDPTHVTDVKDIQRIADLLAYGLVQSQVITPSALQEAPQTSRRARLVLVAVLCTVLLASYGMWMTDSHVDPQPPLAPWPTPSVRWQQLQVNYEYSAGEPFTLLLPALERTPEKVPVKVMLEPSMATAHWLQLDREQLQMQGTAPITAAGQTYQLIVRAQADQGSESRLQVALTITGQPQPPPSAADSPPLPPPAARQPPNPDRPSEAPGTMKIWHFW